MDNGTEGIPSPKSEGITDDTNTAIVDRYILLLSDILERTKEPMIETI